MEELPARFGDDAPDGRAGMEMAQSKVTVKDTGSTPGHTRGSERLRRKYGPEAREGSRGRVKNCDRIRAGVFKVNQKRKSPWDNKKSEHYITSLLGCFQCSNY